RHRIAHTGQAKTDSHRDREVGARRPHSQEAFADVSGYSAVGVCHEIVERPRREEQVRRDTVGRDIQHGQPESVGRIIEGEGITRREVSSAREARGTFTRVAEIAIAREAESALVTDRQHIDRARLARQSTLEARPAREDNERTGLWVAGEDGLEEPKEVAAQERQRHQGEATGLHQQLAAWQRSLVYY